MYGNNSYLVALGLFSGACVIGGLGYKFYQAYTPSNQYLPITGVENKLQEMLCYGEKRIIEIADNVRQIKEALAQYNNDAQASLRQCRFNNSKQTMFSSNNSERPHPTPASNLANQLTELLGATPQPDQNYTKDIVKCEDYLNALEENHQKVMDAASVLLPELMANLNQLNVNREKLAARLG
jgi:hypothetical protein